jgi:hypothetical protein
MEDDTLRYEATAEGPKVFTKPWKTASVTLRPSARRTHHGVRPDGTVQTWEIEAGAPTAMFRRGFTKDSLPIGTEIVVGGYPAKNGSQRVNGRDLTFPDGRKLFMGSSAPDAPDKNK